MLPQILESKILKDLNKRNSSDEYLQKDESSIEFKRRMKRMHDNQE
jgi:hypothetical protein